jgi:hypothetical protein
VKIEVKRPFHAHEQQGEDCEYYLDRFGKLFLRSQLPEPPLRSRASA